MTPPVLPTSEANPAQTLLCERCGYGLRGLSSTGHCPECGATIASSLAATRPGSPWQQRQSLRTWFSTNAMALTTPRSLFRSIRIAKGQYSLLNVNLLMGGVVVWLIYSFIAVLLAGMPFSHQFDGDQLIDGVFPTLILVVLGSALARLLVKIEEWGIRAWGRVHRRRITPLVARCIVDHASVGWLVPIPAILALHLLDSMVLRTDALMELTFKVTDALQFFGLRGMRVLGLVLAVFIVGFIPAIVIFEILVYLGVRQCQYANPPHAEAEVKIIPGACDKP